MEGLIAFSASTACLVWRTFSSMGNAERSKTMESKPALQPDALGEGVRMVCVKKMGKSNSSRKLGRKPQFDECPQSTLTLGQTNQRLAHQFPAAANTAFSKTMVRNVEMADGHATLLCFLQEVS